jgi:hypothetical protein
MLAPVFARLRRVEFAAGGTFFGVVGASLGGDGFDTTRLWVEMTSWRRQAFPDTIRSMKLLSDGRRTSPAGGRSRNPIRNQKGMRLLILLRFP